MYAGPPPVKAEAALRVCAPLLEAARRQPCELDDPASHCRDQKARTRRTSGRRTSPRRCEKKLPLAAAAAHAEGPAEPRLRSSAPGSRLQLRKAQAEAGDIVLLFGDEARR